MVVPPGDDGQQRRRGHAALPGGVVEERRGALRPVARVPSAPTDRHRPPGPGRAGPATPPPPASGRAPPGPRPAAAPRGGAARRRAGPGRRRRPAGGPPPPRRRRCGPRARRPPRRGAARSRRPRRRRRPPPSPGRGTPRSTPASPRGRRGSRRRRRRARRCRTAPAPCPVRDAPAGGGGRRSGRTPRRAPPVRRPRCAVRRPGRSRAAGQGATSAVARLRPRRWAGSSRSPSMAKTTTGTPHSRASAVTSTDTSVTNRLGRASAIHAAIAAERSCSPGWCSGAQCRAPSAVADARSTGPSSSRARPDPLAGEALRRTGRAERGHRGAEVPADGDQPLQVTGAVVVHVPADHAGASAVRRGRRCAAATCRYSSRCAPAISQPLGEAGVRGRRGPRAPGPAPAPARRPGRPGSCRSTCDQGLLLVQEADPARHHRHTQVVAQLQPPRVGAVAVAQDRHVQPAQVVQQAGVVEARVHAQVERAGGGGRAQLPHQPGVVARERGVERLVVHVDAQLHLRQPADGLDQRAQHRRAPAGWPAGS